MHDTVSVRRRFRIVRDHQDGLPEAAHSDRAESSARLREFWLIQIPGGLVRQQNRRVVARARARSPRAAARRPKARWVCDPAGSRCPASPGYAANSRRIAAPLFPPEIARQVDIVPRRQVRQQIEFLEDEADVFGRSFVRPASPSVAKSFAIHLARCPLSAGSGPRRCGTASTCRIRKAPRSRGTLRA